MPPPSSGHGGSPRPGEPLRIAYLSYRGKPHVGGQGVYTRHLTKALVDLGHHVEVLGGQPYPVLDPRVPLVKLPSLDIFNDTYPGRFPAYWEIKHWQDLVEIAQFSTGRFSEPLAFSLQSLALPRRPQARVRPRPRQPVPRLRHLGHRPLPARPRDPAPPDHEGSGPRGGAHAPNAKKRRSVNRWYGFVKMQARVARQLPRVVVVSENSINDIHTDFGVPRENMRLVPVGVDPELFKPLPHVERQPGRLITTASADVALKGLSYLLEALAKLRTERDVTLTVIGRPKPGGRSAETIEKLGLTEVVSFVSGVPDERIVELYAEAELAIVPSLYEGFSLPAAEAMATGTALVATTGGALPEVTGTDGETVLSCPAGDADALAATIRRGLDDPALRAKVGAAGRERVISRWSWTHTATATVEQYRELLDMRARAGQGRTS